MKKVLFVTIVLSVTLSSIIGNVSLSVENGSLSGMVTYKGSYESPNQADGAGEIYAIHEADLRSTPYDDIARVLENFQRNKSGYSLSLYNTIDPVVIKNAQDNFDAASNFTFDYISGFKQLPGIVRAATNSVGNYTLSLRPGKYYILVVSGSVKSDNTAESHGNIAFKTVDISSSGKTSMDFNFEKSENMLIMLLTGWQRDGC